jgi:flagellar biosynthesis repressor protein FlbT
MALKITLKPHERIVIGGAVVTNGSIRSELFFENKVPILRAKDIMTESDASSPSRRIYFVIQLMYIDEGNLTTHHKQYWRLVRDFLEAAPSAMGIIDSISNDILSCNYYQALRNCKKLIAYEEEIVARV